MVMAIIMLNIFIIFLKGNYLRSVNYLVSSSWPHSGFNLINLAIALQIYSRQLVTDLATR